MVRRRIAAAIGVVVLVVIVLIVSSVLNGQKVSALQEYNRNVNAIAQASEADVGKKLFSALLGASGTEPLKVEVALERLQAQARRIAAHAREISVPSELAEAQRNLLLALDLRSEGVSKIASLVHTALGGKHSESVSEIAGDMEMFLASDVIWSQRIKPLIAEGLASGGASGQSTAVSRFLPNLGWLSTSTVQSRIGGEASSSSSPAGPGTHGDALTGVSVGTTALQPEPAVTNVSSGGHPTVTVAVQDSGENEERGVKVQVAATAGGNTKTATRPIERMKPGETVNLEVPISVPVGVPAKLVVKVAKVPGETNLENNEGSFLVVFE